MPRATSSAILGSLAPRGGACWGFGLGAAAGWGWFWPKVGVVKNRPKNHKTGPGRGLATEMGVVSIFPGFYGPMAFI